MVETREIYVCRPVRRNRDQKIPGANGPRAGLGEPGFTGSADAGKQDKPARLECHVVTAQRPFVEPKSLTADVRADLLPGMFLLAALQGTREWWARRDHPIHEPLNNVFRKRAQLIRREHQSHVLTRIF
jgi:hypothetical protein